MEITPELFHQQRRPRFGATNPELMHMAFWEWMICGGEDISRVREDPKFRGFGSYYARDVFKASASSEDGPVWTFARYGATRTQLADGRVVCIGGEHEDFYDPDFCIYNDVVVLTPANRVEIYGYPPEVFPPTDFHTATLVENRLFIIGSLGYQNARNSGETLVHIVNLPGYEISRMLTSGEAPGWIHDHAAEFDPDGAITIHGGRIVVEHNGKQVFQRNFDDYSLNISSGIWRRLTNRKWHQFNVRQEDGKLFVLERHPEIKALFPEGAKILPKSSVSPEFTRIDVGGAPIAVAVGVMAIEIVVEDDLPEPALLGLAGQIRAKAEAAIHKACILEKI
jgi:hypothetical protein